MFSSLDGAREDFTENINVLITAICQLWTSYHHQSENATRLTRLTPAIIRHCEHQFDISGLSSLNTGWQEGRGRGISSKLYLYNTILFIILRVKV